jgi:hypothetical protein
MAHDHSHLTDSAGQPWAGRSFEPTAFADDDGSAPAGLIKALAAFRSGAVSQLAVVDEFRVSRLLIPLVANLGESALNERGVVVDKSADLSIVTVAGPDGRNVLPVFSSVAAMQHWNPQARPVPSDAVRVALAAADEGTDLVVLDPTSSTEFLIRRPALWAIAQSKPWTPSFGHTGVEQQFRDSIEPERAVSGVSLSAGDPDARLRGPELVVTLSLVAGLDQTELDALLARLQQRWSHSEVIADLVDSLAVKLTPA